MTTSEILSLVLSVVTVAISVLALAISLRQARQQNNLALLDKRVSLLEIARSLTEPPKFHKKSFEDDVANKDNEPLYAIAFSFSTLTNSSYLQDISDVACHPREGEYRNRYLLKLEDLRKQSDLFEMAFPASIGKDFSELCLLYVLTLTAAYKYAVCLNSIKKESPNAKNKELEFRTRNDYKTCMSQLLEKSKKIEESKLYERLKKETRVCRARRKNDAHVQ